MIQHTPFSERKQILIVGFLIGLIVGFFGYMIFSAFSQTPTEMILEDNVRLRERIDVLTEYVRIHTFRG